MSFLPCHVVRIDPNGPPIPAVGFGVMGLSHAYGSVGCDNDRLKVLDRAWEIGCVHWDTSISYGDNEILIGKWFKLHPERRKDIFLATKFGIKGTDKGLEGIEVDASPENCKASLEISLERLGVESVDLYYLHRADPAIPIEKTVQVMSELQKAGKVKCLGLSEVSSSTLRRAHALHPIAAVQVEYNPWTLDIEGPSGTNLLDTCKELNVAVVAYSPLGRGILTGKYRSKNDFEHGDLRGDLRHILERYQDENFQKNLALVDKFEEIAKRKGCTVGQLTLAWLIAQWEKVLVIPGTKKIQYLEENFMAQEVEITADEVLELRKLVSTIGVSGSRNPFFGQFVDTLPL
ncbi:Aldo-keto reductase str7 [Paramyrothecium foliicola]|nr:Aldo-keto reductase str7 [Paramyrothecium foliicola]